MSLNLEEIFYRFHMTPELSYKEYETTASIKKILGQLNIQILDSSLLTGVIALIPGENHDSPIALRADIDALPITEQTNLPYKSRNDGVMHACGHDFHTTALLGAADILKDKKLQRDVYLIFQPAEEAPGGARKVIETGLLKNVKEYFAIHTSPDHKVGAIGIKKGPVMAAVDKFEIIIKGKGTHAGHPDKGVDPVVVSAAVIQSAQTIISRNTDPFEPGLVSITHIEGGNTWNVIPETVYMEGTVRTLSPDNRQLVKQRLEDIAVHTAKAYSANATVKWYEGPPAVINDTELVSKAKIAAKRAGLIAEDTCESLGGEDFSYYLENAKGAFLRIGTGGNYPNHHPAFTADAQALKKASCFLAWLAIGEKEYEKDF